MSHDNCDTCARLDRIEQMLIALVASFDAGKPRDAAPAAAAPAGPVDLDSEYGNFRIKKDPPRWKGKSYVGKKLSETEPDYLDAMASLKQWAAGKDREAGKDPKWAELDSARCAGWAARLRARPAPTAADESDAVPF